MHRRHRLRTAAALTGLALVAPALAEPPPVLDAPESAHWHAGTRSWYVSSLGGGLSVARDGVGWISRFDAEGRVLDARWVEGLDAPTGIASVGERLFVADRAGLLEIDVTAAKVTRTVALAGSEGANDVAAGPDGTLYVSDMGANRIFRIRPGAAAEVWVESAALEGPNGLWVDGDRLIVATWGPPAEGGGFVTRHPGTLLAVNLADGRIAPLGDGAPVASMDGIVRVGGHFFVTDWMGGRLLRFDASGRHEVALSGLPNPADLGYSASTNTLALPLMSGNRLMLVHLGALAGK